MSVVKLSKGDVDKIAYLSNMRTSLPLYYNKMTMIPVDNNIIMIKYGWKAIIFFSLELLGTDKTYTVLVSCRISEVIYRSHVYYRDANGSSTLPFSLIQQCETEIMNRLIYLSDYCRSLTEFYLIDDSTSMDYKIQEFQHYCELAYHGNFSLERE